MNGYWGMVVAAAAGFAIVLQVSVNGVCSHHLGKMPAVFMTHIIGAVLALGLIGIEVWYLSAANRLHWQALAVTPWYAYTGGILGVVIVFLTLHAIQLLPLATMFAIVTVAQLILGAIFDHYGCFGMPKVSFSLQKLGGICALALGVYLLKK